MYQQPQEPGTQTTHRAALVLKGIVRHNGSFGLAWIETSWSSKDGDEKEGM